MTLGNDVARNRKPSATPTTKIRGAASAAKLLGIILCFSAQRPHWTVAELCEALDVSLSTMYRYIALLREVGLVDTYDLNGYRLSKRFIALARAAQHGESSLDRISLPIITGIRDRTNETVLIARRHRDYVYCVERVESTQAVRLQFERGQPMSLHRGAAARLLLAYAPDMERGRYLAAVADKVDRKSARMLTQKVLAEVAKQGFTESFGEIDDGIWGAAAAIRDDEQVVAAVAIAAPIFRTSARKRQQLIAEVRRGADEISFLLRQGAVEDGPAPAQPAELRPVRAKRIPAAV
jgi:DNA-binding IclR family transcriptional regulator